MFTNTLALKNNSRIANGALIIIASLLLGLLGKIAIYLPFTPVPIAVQCQACLLLGALLGARRAAAAVFAFLAQGAIGLPVFTPGAVGLAKFMGPTGGYLIGYLVAAYIVGALFERGYAKTPLRAFGIISLGNGAVFLLGAVHLAFFTGVNQALLLGVAPFLIGDFLKNVACVKLLQWMKR